MKIYKIFILIIVLFLISCKEVVNNNEDPSTLKVISSINDIIVDEGTTTVSIDLSNVFAIEDNPNAEIFKSIYSNQNPSLVQTIINADSLSLLIQIGQTGNSEITIRGEYEGEVEYNSFILTVNSISDNDALNMAISHFQNSDYEIAEIYFEVLVCKNNIHLLSDAYMGLGFSQMRLEKFHNSYNSFQMSLTNDANNNHTKSGLSLLEYAYKNNYIQAIRYGQEIISTNANYIFKYDSTLNHFDIILNIALSQYALQLFDECLLSIQSIDSGFILNSSDPEFQTKLFIKLEELINTYNP